MSKNFKNLDIFYSYETIQKPWGGANTFLNYLYKSIETKKGIKLIPINQFKDNKRGIFFLNQLGTGPKNKSRKFNKEELKFFIKSHNKLIVRAVSLHGNLRRKCKIPFLTKEWGSDKLTIYLCNNADHVIFQSKYQLNVFKKFGFKGNSFSIINNASTISDYLNSNHNKFISNNDLKESNLNLISSTFSTKLNKRFDLIAKFSKINNVNIDHFGNWPKNVDPCEVKIRNTVSHKELVFEILKRDFLLHPAEKDMCPNSVIEALSIGVPVIYGSNSSSAEIVKENGIQINLKRMEETVNFALKRKKILKNNLKINKFNYRIEKASLKYLNVFKNFS